MIFNVLPLALQQLTVGRPEVARGYGDRFLFVLLKETNASHISSDHRQNGFAIRLRVSSGCKYRREWKFNAELDQIDYFIEPGAAADESRAADVRGIYGTAAKRGEAFRRPAD